MPFLLFSTSQGQTQLKTKTKSIFMITKGKGSRQEILVMYWDMAHGERTRSESGS